MIVALLFDDEERFAQASMQVSASPQIDLRVALAPRLVVVGAQAHVLRAFLQSRPLQALGARRVDEDRAGLTPAEDAWLRSTLSALESTPVAGP